jgi:SAM-dependent methyltransferase
MNCSLCHAQTELLRCFPQSVTSESKLIPAASMLHVCCACGHLQSSLELDLARYYAEHYDALLTDEGHDEIVSTPDGSIVFRTDVDYALMKQHLGAALQDSPSILEFGCGHGRILSRLYKEGHRRLAAYDVSDLYRDSVAPFVAPDALFIGTRPTRGEYDVMISFFVLEHDTDPFGSLRYLRTRVAAAGRLYLMLPNYVSNAADLACADHVNHFSPRTLSALVEASGFRVLTLDDSSAIGAVALVAEPTEAGAGKLTADPDRVHYARATSAEFLDYIERLERLAQQLRGKRVALYGAGFYGVLVQAHLEHAGARIVDVFDANPRKQGGERLGMTVREPEALASGQWRDTDLVMCINPRIAASVGQKFSPHVSKVHVI